jgi:phospholipid transport system substrate-binding protein
MKKIIALIALLILPFQAFAIDNAEQAEVRTFVEKVGNDIVGIANQKISETKKREKIITIVDSVIDADWIARFVLGKNYKTATDVQREQFIKLYRDFMINTYGPKFKNYDGRKFTVNEVTQQSSFLLAKAEFLPRDSNVAISVDFRVKKRDGKLVILDFIAEGISLIETQRSEFNSAIATQGMDEFLKNLGERVKKLKNSTV